MEQLISDLKKVNSFLKNDDDANRIMGINLLSSLEITPKEMIDCALANLSSSRMIEVEIIDDKDYNIHVDIGCVCYSGHSDIINHIYKIKNIKSFSYLCDNIIIPENFKTIKNLKKLSSQYTPKNKGKEEYLFDIISELKELEHLSLNQQGFDFIPDSIGALKKLKYLSIYGNDIKDLPQSILNLRKLKTLSVSECKFDTLPEEIFKLDSLEELYLSKLPTTKFPKEIIQLKNLKKLDIKRNNFSEIPKEILELKNLEHLDIITSNNITNVPEFIFEMDYLKKLRVSKQFSQEELNRLKEIFGERLDINSY